jgi:hypothetical protein
MLSTLEVAAGEHRRHVAICAATGPRRVTRRTLAGWLANYT